MERFIAPSKRPRASRPRVNPEWLAPSWTGPHNHGVGTPLTTIDVVLEDPNQVVFRYEEDWMVQAARVTVAAHKGAREREIARKYDAMVAMPFPGDIVIPHVPNAERLHPRTPSPGPPDGGASWLLPVSNGATIPELIRTIGEADCPSWMAESHRAWGQLRAMTYTESDEEVEEAPDGGEGKGAPTGGSSSSSSSAPSRWLTKGGKGKGKKGTRGRKHPIPDWLWASLPKYMILWREPEDGAEEVAHNWREEEMVKCGTGTAPRYPDWDEEAWQAFIQTCGHPGIPRNPGRGEEGKRLASPFNQDRMLRHSVCREDEQGHTCVNPYCQRQHFGWANIHRDFGSWKKREAKNWLMAVNDKAA